MSALEVCSWQGDIQIYVYIIFTLPLWQFTMVLQKCLLDNEDYQCTTETFSAPVANADKLGQLLLK